MSVLPGSWGSYGVCAGINERCSSRALPNLPATPPHPGDGAISGALCIFGASGWLVALVLAAIDGPLSYGGPTISKFCKRLEKKSGCILAAIMSGDHYLLDEGPRLKRCRCLSDLRSPGTDRS